MQTVSCNHSIPFLNCQGAFVAVSLFLSTFHITTVNKDSKTTTQNLHETGPSSWHQKSRYWSQNNWKWPAVNLTRTSSGCVNYVFCFRATEPHRGRLDQQSLTFDTGNRCSFPVFLSNTWYYKKTKSYQKQTQRQTAPMVNDGLIFLSLHPSVWVSLCALPLILLWLRPCSQTWWTYIIHFPLFDKTCDRPADKQSTNDCCCLTSKPIIWGFELHFCPCRSELTAPARESINKNRDAGSALLLARWLLFLCLLSDYMVDYEVSNGGLFAERVYWARQQKETRVGFHESKLYSSLF